MSAMRFCSKCVLPETFPKISFDESGVCNYCRKTEKYLDFESLRAENEVLIEKRVAEAKALGRPYDGVVCYSGGKDSTYTLIKAKEKFGLNLLAFTFDNSFLSEIAFDNIRTIVDRLGVDHIFFRPTKADVIEVYRIAASEDVFPSNLMTRISSICYACITMVNTFAYNLAVEKRIPLIFAGFNLGQIPLNAVVYQYNPETLAEFRQQGLAKLLNRCTQGQGRYFEFSKQAPDPLPFYLNPMSIEKISEEEILKAIAEYGWKLPTDVDSCSTNCRLNQLANCLHKQRFKFSPYALELTSAIQGGLIDREAALDKLQHDFDPEQVVLLARELGLNINFNDKPLEIF